MTNDQLNRLKEAIVIYANAKAQKCFVCVDDRNDKPFYCSSCGNTYEPCNHWSEEEGE